MTLQFDSSIFTQNEIRNFEVVSKNSSGVLCKGGIVMIPKANYSHLSVDEAEYLLIKFLEIQKNKAEIPKTILLQSRRTDTDVKISGQMENYIFDDMDTVYLDLLRRPVGQNRDYSPMAARSNVPSRNEYHYDRHPLTPPHLDKSPSSSHKSAPK